PRLREKRPEPRSAADAPKQPPAKRKRNPLREPSGVATEDREALGPSGLFVARNRLKPKRLPESFGRARGFLIHRPCSRRQFAGSYGLLFTRYVPPHQSFSGLLVSRCFPSGLT